MATWVDLCSVGEIPEGEGKSFEVKGKTIGVFQSQGQIRAIDDHCPHMGAPLSDFALRTVLGLTTLR